MSINRRDFLGTLGVGSMAAAIPAVPNEQPAPLNQTWDMSWVESVKGKYRAVFDSPAFSDGAGLFRAEFWRSEYKEVYGTPASDMSPVVVVRHEGIWLAMNDEFWKKYSVGKRQKFKNGETKQWYDRNPIATTAPGSPPEFDVNVAKFISQGGVILACGLAFQGVVGVVAKQDKISKEEADKTARKYLLPGVILQPSGVFAVLRAQEAGCHYILAS